MREGQRFGLPEAVAAREAAVQQVLSQKLTGQMPVTADWEDAAL
eukprot:COSAG01_NODE_48412_length_381_cov_1.390071_2_plen_43_part_01